MYYLIQEAKHYLEQNPALKWVLAFIWSMLSILAPIKGVLFTIFMLTAVDFIFGVWASHKVKEKFVSGRARSTFNKLFVYSVVIILLFLIQLNIWEEWAALGKIAATSICLVELVSILENSSTILGQPVFKFLINKLGSMSNKEKRK